MHDVFTSSILRMVIAGGLISGGAKLVAQAPTSPPGGIDNYEPGPDSKPQRGVPTGKTFSFRFEGSRIYPNSYAVWVQQIEVESDKSVQQQPEKKAVIETPPKVNPPKAEQA